MLDNFLSVLPHLFRSDGTFHYLPSLKRLGVEHVQSQQYRCFNFEWAWCKIFEFSNFVDGILEHPQPESLKFPRRHKFSVFCGPLASLAVSTAGTICCNYHKLWYTPFQSRGNHIQRKGLCGEKVCVEKRFVWIQHKLSQDTNCRYFAVGRNCFVLPNFRKPAHYVVR